MSMTYQLWRSSAARQSSRRFLAISSSLRSQRHPATRLESLSRSQHRSYATNPPETPKDENHSAAKQDGQHTSPGKPAKGLEGLYGSSGPLSSSFSSRGAGGNGKVDRFTADEEELLNYFVKRAHADLPQVLAKELEDQISMVRKYGHPEDVRVLLKEIMKGEPITLSKAARVMRMSARMVRQAEETKEKSEGKQEQKQKQEKTSGDQSQSGNEAPRFGDFKLDTGSMITAAFTAYLVYRTVMPSENTREITWQEFQTSLLDKGLVEKLLVLNGDHVKVFVHREAVKQMHPDSPAAQPNFHYVFTIGSVEGLERKLDAVQNDLDIPTSERIPVSYKHEISWSSTAISLLPIALIIGSMVWFSRRAGGGGGGGSSGIFGMGRSRAKRFNHEADIKIRFKDVAGMDEAKQEIMEFVSFLKEPGEFQRLGAKIPRGAILSGPPGTGKTLLAKATAGESQVPFFSVSGSEFVEMFVGVGASRVRDLFANARKSTPCIIFIDEIDAIGKSRGKQYFGGGNDEREATLNQILTEMDGFNTSEQVVVLAGTNRPDVLDSALMRPGRFDRHIAIDRPTMEGRKQIFAVHLRKILTDENMEHLTGRLAALTPGFSGADIANACNEAALIGKYPQSPPTSWI